MLSELALMMTVHPSSETRGRPVGDMQYNRVIDETLSHGFRSLLDKGCHYLVREATPDPIRHDTVKRHG